MFHVLFRSSMNTSPNGYVLYVLHHLAVKVGDVARATQMVGMVVELQVLVGVACATASACAASKEPSSQQKPSPFT